MLRCVLHRGSLPGWWRARLSQSTVTQPEPFFVADLLHCDWHHRTWLLDPNARPWSVLCADVDSNYKRLDTSVLSKEQLDGLPVLQPSSSVHARPTTPPRIHF